jgi:carboxyl-terminal processing protease
LDVRLITANLIDVHYSYDSLTPEISKRSLTQFIKSFDPQKNYFLESDINNFESDYGAKIGESLKKTDCRFIDQIANVFNQRYKERQDSIQRAIALKHDFNVDEYLVFDPKELPWAKSPAELDDRWRKRIKFQALQLKSTLDDSAVREKLKKRYAFFTASS